MRDQIVDLLRSGLSDRAVARRLGCHPRRVAPIRQELGLPRQPPGPRSAPSLAEAFRARTRRTDDGHLLWTGAIDKGRPRLTHCKDRYDAHQLAFRLRTGRDPQGKARSDCGIDLCVDPAHTDDAAGRAQYTAIFGRTA